ncbi:16S rRNA (guanine(966)-N(2))-methyltransferase RsmD [Fredinandcohnia quinoae]|uniref:16S rRNA (Guanine(966)-N(2))-methyltransferase RsmD n=1 Tax=Fredinandcohnia quinoae TaxID=2918902 RepID=A0AAW5E1L8_9BACI|nr:16S rRNA (guanine(966)-N(2))-methyltransferase RsmD [Fredinandcohnia sp. SECRCQ15]MCH1623901.1 16S rRNA (guanine(966)-N(2))-methyltransferase RsmD [Fredinandcohnia sp. SECRCQ15]
MRVVSGVKKGHQLKAVPGMSTRPTTDKVKEAIFNMIGPFFSGGQALDLFGGSGGLGIEALSRGIEHVIFVDRDPKAIQTIKLNLEICDFTLNGEVYKNEAGRALKAIVKRGLQFDLIFLDPPYKQQKLNQLIKEISEKNLLKKGGYIIAEHGSEIVLDGTIDSLTQVKYEKYGIIAVSIYC